MSGISGGGRAVNSNKPMSALIDDKCDIVGCGNVATMKPVVQLRESPLHNACESFIGVKVCTVCATQKNAEALIEGAKQKAMFQDIFKVQTQGKSVDWSCSGIIWVKIQ